MSANPDLLTRKEAADYLRCSEGRLRKGWGPRPLKQYAPRVMYSRRACDAFLEMRSCEPSNATAPATGGTASSIAGRSTRSQRERRIAAKLIGSVASDSNRSAHRSPPTSRDEEGRT